MLFLKKRFNVYDVYEIMQTSKLTKTKKGKVQKALGPIFGVFTLSRWPEVKIQIRKSQDKNLK